MAQDLVPGLVPAQAVELDRALAREWVKAAAGVLAAECFA